MKTEQISGLDDLFYDVTITDVRTNTAVTTGTVTMRLCTANTTTALAGGTASVTLTHDTGGRWTGTHESSDVATALSGVSIGGAFCRVLEVAGVTTRVVATCTKVYAVGIR